MKLKKFLQKIFSITNIPLEKEIYILGFCLHISRNKIFKFKYKNQKISNNKIVFTQFSGKGYGCNPKYIAQEIIRQKLPYEIVWLVKDPQNEDIVRDFPPDIKLVKYNTKQAMQELATAKIWIDNQRKNYFIKKGLLKKDNQYYIQTWHGGLGFKKFDGDLPEEITQPYEFYSKKDSLMIDYLLSNSSFEDEVFKSAFWYNGKILKTGHPRNDIFFTDYSATKDKVYNQLNIPYGTKLILYAPSYRDDGRLYCFGLEYKNLLKTIQNQYNGSWKILIRLHPNLAKYKQRLIPKNDNIIDVSGYADLQELLVSSDIFITDYSSCIFDFMLTFRPAFIYASDLEEFDSERGFYYPLTATPFPLALNNEQLINNIKKFDPEKYKKDIKNFLIEKGCIEDGKASTRVVELIKTLMSEKS